MGDTATTENGTAKAIGSVETGIISALLPVAKGLEVAATNGFLGLPIISPIFDAAQNWVVSYLERALGTQTTFLVISFQTDQEREAFKEAAIALRGQLSSEEANANFDKMVDRLIRYDGSNAS